MDSKKLKNMVLILGVMAFFANGDNYAVSPLLIDIARDLNISIGDAALSVTAYMLTFGLFTIVFGPLGDRYGKTKIINIAAFGTAIFSILGAFSYNLPYLIIVRALNGAFGAGIFPVTLALIGESFQPEKRQGAIGKVMGMMFLGGASATAVGGAIAYFGSWRWVYFVYGLAELIVALFMVKYLEKTPGVIDKLNFKKVYGEALTNTKLLYIVGTIFLVGFSVFGSFTYSGKYLQDRTGYNILIVGLILTIYGVATVIGGRKAPKLRMKMKNNFLAFAGVLGGASLVIFSISSSVIALGVALFGFGLSFVFLQSTLVSTAQETMPKLRGTVMSLASFNMFVGGAIGTTANRQILNNYNMSNIYLIAGVILIIVGFLGRFAVIKANS